MKNITTTFKGLKKPVKIIVILGLILAGVICIFSIYLTTEYLLPDKMNYVVNDDGKTCTVISAKEPDTIVLRVPKKIDGYIVTGIAPNAFSNYEMMGIVLPKTIDKIGERAFSNCEMLRWVNGIEKCNNLKRIEKETFYKCYGLLKIQLPESIEAIEKSAFFSCRNLMDVNIPKNVQLIGSGAFMNCGCIKNVNIPASVKHIDVMAFTANYSLTKISVDAENPYWCDVDGVLYSKDMKIIHDYPAGKQEKSFTIPEGVTEISSTLFAFNANLEIINIPASVNKIDQRILTYDTINTVNYDGTIKMWNSIKKHADWDEGSPDFTIYCTDGQIAKDGTVTYN